MRNMSALSVLSCCLLSQAAGSTAVASAHAARPMSPSLPLPLSCRVGGLAGLSMGRSGATESARLHRKRKMRTSSFAWFDGVFGGTRSSGEQERSELLRLTSLRQSSKNRDKVEEAIINLAEATANQNRYRKPVRDGVWRLLWSSPSAAANPFSTPDLVLGGKTYQVIRGGRGANVVWWGSSSTKDAPRLVGGAALQKIGSGRLQLTVDSFSLKIPGVPAIPFFNVTKRVGFTVRDAPKGGKRVTNNNSDVLKTLYNDGELRVSQGESSRLLYIHMFEKDEGALPEPIAQAAMG